MRQKGTVAAPWKRPGATPTSGTRTESRLFLAIGPESLLLFIGKAVPIEGRSGHSTDRQAAAEAIPRNPFSKFRDLTSVFRSEGQHLLVLLRPGGGLLQLMSALD